MNIVAKHWATIRQVAYGLLAAALAVAAAKGWITDTQSEQWLNHAVTLLGALGFVVAGLYVDRSPKGTDILPEVVLGPVKEPRRELSPLEQVLAEAENRLNGR